MENNDTSDRLKNLIARFVLKYNYWGYLFSRVRRQASNQLPSIMGVAPQKDGTLILFYHPELVDKTDDETLIKVIEHEGLHILNKHIPRLLRVLSNEISDTKKQFKGRIWNIASDCTVNSQARLPDKLIIAGKDWPLCHPKVYGLEEGKISEEYFNKLLENTPQEIKDMLDQMEANEGKGEGEGQGEGQGKGKNGKGARPNIGDHDNWTKNIDGVADLSSLSRKIDQHSQRIIRESAKTFQKDRGRLPGHIQDLIQGALAPPKAPYYQIIRKLVRGTRFSKFQRSPTRINRKRTYTFALAHDKSIPQISPFPGRMRDFTFEIGVVIDTSGSMSNDDIKEGLSGIKNIIEKDRHCRTTVMEVDTSINKEYVCKKIRDIQFDVKGRGGTTLGAGLFRAKELNVDVCLVFTDGYTEDFSQYPRKSMPRKIIWVITNGGSSQQVNKTGFVIKI